ncbi:hypothetical protein [Heyndrickxia ginsengihumi]|uniref:Uncharacterized protein n=1 Tax=Heyndrickxia ginsengihumi TaxID=363870 RepID=A0A0A6VEG0_9BACI|nr:hypothetical protein [Heyndrickxia ginsengihumi]KHD84929.1 hypothetical protein NG54_12335 [Heyndrickxia ginsengihumi]MBE6184516.1 hypothetical protein [Bacillus sp. (in: firmicutes)]MCM3024789.1 hypothetical protein [Heyndrickxia ginsengihumi]NEY21457.1 hypothetical protein [Heyndrickxia ginsengihumi]
MSLAIISLIAWFVMILFVIMPKWLTVTEIFFLYFIVGIMTVTLFTILDVNLRWVPVTRKVENSFALDICRFIIIPLLVIMAACFLNSPLSAFWRWTMASVIMVILMVDDWIMQWCGLIVFRQWNAFYSFLMYGGVIVMLALISRWFVRLDRGGLEQT